MNTNIVYVTIVLHMNECDVIMYTKNGSSNLLLSELKNVAKRRYISSLQKHHMTYMTETICDQRS